MKIQKLVLGIVILMCYQMGFAQQGINYKALIKDGSGNVLAGTFMNVQFAIHENNATGNIVYNETHSGVSTNVNGLLILAIGTAANPSVGVFEDIDWSTDLHFLQTTIIYSGGTINFDATEFMAVPYAKHATTATFATTSGDTKWVEGTTANDITTTNVGAIEIPGTLQVQATASIDEFSIDGTLADNSNTALPTEQAVKTYVDGNLASGLEALDESNGIGWRLKGRDPANYGDIGLNAIDLSLGGQSGGGAVGPGSFVLGHLNTASGGESFAGGIQNLASGPGSVVFGQLNEATALRSAAFGLATIASGNNSTVFGTQTKANAYSSFAIGSGNIGGGDIVNWVETDPLFEIGNGDNINPSNALTVLKNGTITAPSLDLGEITDDKALITKEYADTNLGASGLEDLDEGNGIGWRLIGRDPANYGIIGQDAVDLSRSNVASVTRGATGNNSTAMGWISTASGQNSTAIGEGTTASGLSSTAMGEGSVAIGLASTAMGLFTDAIGEYSTAMGYITEASGDRSTAMGDSTTASGNVSTAMGYFTEASGLHSTAMGYITEASGDRSTAMGSSTTASGLRSTAMGESTTASGSFSIAIGNETIAPSRAETAIGSYNTDYAPSSATFWDPTDRLFVVGNGPNMSNRSDALVILKNGTTTINGNTIVSGTLAVNGAVVVNGIVVHSDRRLKKDISELPYGLKEVLQLQPKAYYWKDRTQAHKSLGLIAQEVQPLIKEIVSAQDNEEKTLGINYTELIPVLINAIKEQQEIIKSLELTAGSEKLKVATLESDVAELKTMVQQLVVKDETALLEKR